MLILSKFNYIVIKMEQNCWEVGFPSLLLNIEHDLCILVCYEM